MLVSSGCTRHRKSVSVKGSPGGYYFKMGEILGKDGSSQPAKLPSLFRAASLASATVLPETFTV
jgi:hypothetical protein